MTDMATVQGRLALTFFSGLAGCERELIRVRAGQDRGKNLGQAFKSLRTSAPEKEHAGAA